MRKPFEHRREQLLDRRSFVIRMLRHLALSSGFVLASLCIGMAGYHNYEAMNWVDAFLNAAMILGGMGPVAELKTEAGKIFAGCYALYSGMMAIVAVGILAAPVLHRFLHRFHLEED
jgi:hypothetical protein